MTLKEPGLLMELMGKIAARQANISRALASLDYVHYARFVPIPREGLLLIVTEFDGDMANYVLDFAVVLDEEFSTILSYMVDGPPGPVSRYPNEFIAYVTANTRLPDGSPLPDPFSPYPGLSVLDIVGPRRRKFLPPRPSVGKVQVDLDDVQANLLQGFGAKRAVHLAFNAPDRAGACEFLRELISHDTLRPTPQSSRGRELCVNLGLTHAGLTLLGIPQSQLDGFPKAFKDGPAKRAVDLGDSGNADPSKWCVGGPVAADGELAHGLVSLLVRDLGDERIRSWTDELIELMERHGIRPVWKQEARALDDFGTVHFGFRDGLSQPRIDGIHPAPAPAKPGDQPHLPPGDFLLGKDYMNSRGGFHIGLLDEQIALNGSYAVMRVIRQFPYAFEDMLEREGRRLGLDPELIAAKLIGRWRNGVPLSLPDLALAPPTGKDPASLNRFDYVPPFYDDYAGARCPFGAHIRRMAPRGGLVLGVPWGRTVIRRGLAYGEALEPSDTDDSADRGLVGMFICGDIESQFEFLVRSWAAGDLSAPGLRGSQDVLAAGRASSTPFTFRASESEDPVTIDVPPLTLTVGSLYLFVPGLKALNRLVGPT
ncbi:MAG: hypothetical protein JSR59_25860 [Proteobacteria bacterium]|nr:hypothetical protein [Pseudomonadota bacterium]